jgi:hypothetical protein
MGFPANTQVGTITIIPSSCGINASTNLPTPGQNPCGSNCIPEIVTSTCEGIIFPVLPTSCGYLIEVVALQWALYSFNCNDTITCADDDLTCSTCDCGKPNCPQVLTTNAIAQSNTSFTQRSTPQQFIQSSQQLVQSPQQLVQSPQQFVQAPQQFVQSPQQFARSSQQFVQPPQQFVQSPQQFTPQQTYTKPPGCAGGCPAR